MKVKDTTTELKRVKTSKKPAGFPTATLKKTAARAGHGAVSATAVPYIAELYKQKLAEIAPKIEAMLEMSKRKTVKSKDVQVVFSTNSLSGILSAS
jgi:histone H3/H4